MMRSSSKVVSGEFESDVGLDSNSLWIIERAKGSVGGPCKWDDSFRLLHLNSGQFLSIVDGARSDEASLVCQSDERANATLFRLQKVKGDNSLKLDGKPGVIFPSQPFLVCKDPTTDNASKTVGPKSPLVESADTTLVTEFDAEDPDRNNTRRQSTRCWLSSADLPTASDEKPEAVPEDPLHGVSFAVQVKHRGRIQVRIPHACLFVCLFSS